MHHGILGQTWGGRRYQNADGTLTPAGRKHLQKADNKFIKKNEKRIYKETYAKSRDELREFVNNNPNMTYISFNKKMAEVMNKNVGDIPAPSGRVVRYVAKRGSTGVYTALADASYDMNLVKNGVWNSGRIGYKKTGVEVTKN